MVHLKLLSRYALAPYAAGGPVVASGPSGQTATYRDGATGQVFVRQPPVNISSSLIIVLVIFFMVMVMFFIVLVIVVMVVMVVMVIMVMITEAPIRSI